MDWKRVLRIAVCLVLVCTLVIGISPLRADAFVVEATTVSAVGLTLYLYLLWSGFVVPPPDTGIYQDLDDSFRHYLDDLGIDESSWASDADDLDDEWESSDSSDGDESDSSGSVTINVGQTLRNLMRAFVCGGLVKASIDLLPDIEVPSSGWTYYGDYLLPTLPEIDGLPYKTITRYEDTKFVIHLTSKPLVYNSTMDALYPNEGSMDYVQIHLSDTDVSQWDSYSHFTIPKKNSTSTFLDYTYDIPIWSNHDIFNKKSPYNLYFAGSDPISAADKYLVPSAILGSIAGGIQNGTLAEEDVNLPPILDVSSVIKSGMANYHEDMMQAAQDLIDGRISHEDFQEQLAYNEDTGEDIPGVNDPVVNPDDPGGDYEQIPADATFSNFPVLNFLAQLGQLLQDISDGNLLGVKSFFDPWFESIGQWFQDVRGDISGVRDDLSDVDSSVQDVVDSNLEQNDILEQGFSAVSSIVAGAISNAAGEVVDAVKSTVVPDEDFLTNKVNTLCDEFSFVDSIVKTGTALHLGLAGISTEPPVIYIDLGANRGPHYLGGQVPFLDLRWYAEYKPTVDTIISAFLWICFVWRIFMNLPGIISGMPGDFVYHAADSMGVAPSLPARSAEYEHLRILNRRSMHRRE